MTSRLWLFVPIPALVAGIITMACNGVPAAIWSQNIATVALCIVLCAAYRTKPFYFKFETLSWPYLIGAPAAIASTFLNNGLYGVHRWVLPGPVRLHIASIVLPIFIIQLAASATRKTAFAWSAALLTAALLILQPDASEASAFICAVLSIIMAQAGGRRSVLFLGTLTFVVLTCFAIVRTIPDGLPSVAYVEGIIKMAAVLHPAVAACGILGMAILPLPFLYEATTGHRAKRAAALAAGVYFIVIILISVGTGAYPIMVFGYGASPILGYYLACRAIQILDHQPDAETSRGFSQSAPAPPSSTCRPIAERRRFSNPSPA